MAAFIPFINTAEIVMQFDQQGVPGLVTLGVKKGAALSPTDLDNIGDLACAWITGQIGNYQHNSITWNQVKVTDLTTQFAPVSIRTTGLPATGGVATGGVVGAQCAMVVSFQTANRGRSYRGRMYIPSLPASALQTASTWSTTAAGNVQSGITSLLSTLTLAGYQPCILSRQENLVRRLIGVATPITTFTVHLVMGTQRRRIS